MLADLRTRSKLREFLLQWLKVDQPPEIAKDKERFPGFHAGSGRRPADVARSVSRRRGVERDVRLPPAACKPTWLYLNGRLAQFYRRDLPPDAPFQKMALEPSERAGVLTHPYLMAGFAYTATSSPIHRGVFIARSVLGRSLRPPPKAVAPLPAELHADLTTRERVALQTKPEACQSCHAMINPLGFTLENFDAVGRFRTRGRRQADRRQRRLSHAVGRGGEIRRRPRAGDFPGRQRRNARRVRRAAVSLPGQAADPGLWARDAAEFAKVVCRE